MHWTPEQVAQVLRHKERSRNHTPEDGLAVARRSGRYMVAVWFVENNTLCCNRWLEGLPECDFDEAVRQLQRDLDAERGK